MRKIIASLLFSLVFCLGSAFAQDLKTSVGNNKELDSLREKEENHKDSVVFNSKFIRYTTYKLTKDSIQTLPIDTSLTGIHNFSLIAQPRRPVTGTGLLGLAARPLLFEPTKTIGFDVGFHALDLYAMKHDDVVFYRARSPFTSLYYVAGGDKEQVLKITHSQNISKNLNVGANFNRIGANGDYTHQRGDDLNGVLFAWYQSPSKRYNLWFDAIFNTMKAQENGSILKENIFDDNSATLADKKAESPRLSSARQLFRRNSFMLKQSYFVGRIDSTGLSNTQNILPTNKVTYSLSYTNNSYSFKKDEEDFYEVLPKGVVDPIFTNDSTSVKHLQNEFNYSFFLRPKGGLFKNELKVTAGIRHDFYQYAQFVQKRDSTTFTSEKESIQNITLLGSGGYRFSNRLDLNLDVQQILQGRNAGDFFYEAKSNLFLSKKIGVIVLGAYIQNKSPESLYNQYLSNHYSWDFPGVWNRTKIANLSFNYLNNLLNLDAEVSYSLISNYLYFTKNGTNGILPAQETSDISLLKVSIGKKFKWWKTLHLDAYVVYQKTDFASVLRTPEVYTFNSLYKEQTFFKKLKTQIGFDIRYNTPFLATSYSPAASQFYNGDNITLGTKPIVDAWVKVGLRRANLFLKYDYANQGLFGGGFYTTNLYPMPDRVLKFGVIWNFYD